MLAIGAVLELKFSEGIKLTAKCWDCLEGQSYRLSHEATTYLHWRRFETSFAIGKCGPQCEGATSARWCLS